MGKKKALHNCHVFSIFICLKFFKVWLFWSLFTLETFFLLWFLLALYRSVDYFFDSHPLFFLPCLGLWEWRCQDRSESWRKFLETPRRVCLFWWLNTLFLSVFFHQITCLLSFNCHLWGIISNICVLPYPVCQILVVLINFASWYSLTGFWWKVTWSVKDVWWVAWNIAK